MEAEYCDEDDEELDDDLEAEAEAEALRAFEANIRAFEERAVRTLANSVWL